MSTKLADKGNWDEDFPQNDGKEETKNEDGSENLPFMTFPEAKTYRVRLIGSHVRYWKHWQPINIITHIDYKKEDPAWKAGFYPNKRFAIHLIDREDGKLKILDKGNSIFKKFAEFRTLHNVNPAGRDAPDFFIIVTIPKGKDGKLNKMKTEYSVDAARENSPLTDAEVAMYKEKKVNLQEKYRASSLDKIKDLWNSLPDDQKVAPEREKKDGAPSVKKEETPSPVKEEPVEEKMTDAPAEADDMFEEKVAEGADSSDLW